MWSDNYYYLNIYKDESLSHEVSTNKLIDFIDAIPELERSGAYKFKNTKSFPYTQLLLLKSKNLDSWNEKDTNAKSTNLITIVCSKGAHIDFKEIERVFVKIASFLQWTIVEEKNDDGIENYTIWKPE
ncbi:hypothetical protein [Aquimarina rubra]|uniref:Uncharacterized protein n=1 Tax=Aquimarina rubra TaxID=1920033 RepID=A0ABW5LDF0_9FLAO